MEQRGGESKEFPEAFFPGHPDFIKTVSRYSRELGQDVMGMMVKLMTSWPGS